MATGLGKGNQFANLARHLKPTKRMMLLVHTIDLVEQGAKRIADWNPGMRVGIEMADRFATDEPVVAASVQTLGREDSSRMSSFNPMDFEFLVIDESHRATADSYVRIIDYFVAGNPDILIVGFTATPNRADFVPLGQVFDEIVFDYGIQKGIANGWLVDIKGIRVKTKTDISNIKTVAGDFKQDELEAAVNTPERNQLIADAWVENCYPRKTVVFCVDVQHAKDMALVFQMKGIPAEAVWGADPIRKEKMERFKSDQTMVMMNVKLLTEGFDLWSISCVVPAAPTKSQGRLVQQVGRGTRLQVGMWNLNEARANGALLSHHKTDCLVMDVCDVTGKHSLVTLPSLFGLGPKLDLNGKSVMGAVKAIEDAQYANPNVDFSRLEDITKLKSFVESINLWSVNFCTEITDSSELCWHKFVDNSYRLLMPGKEQLVIKGNLLGQFAVRGTVMGERIEMGEFTSLPDALAFAEHNVATKGKQMLTLLRREAKWHSAQVTDSQVVLMKKFGMPRSEIAKHNKGTAAKWLNQRIGSSKR